MIVWCKDNDIVYFHISDTCKRAKGHYKTNNNNEIGAIN